MKPLREIILIRHGTTEANTTRTFTGKGDIPLNAHGRREAAALRSRVELQNADAYWCSPMLRVRETAELALGPDHPLRFDDNLREVDFGDWEGRAFDEIIESEKETMKRWRASDTDFSFPGGENLHEFFLRVSRAAEAITRTPGDGRIVVFAHGGVIRALISHWLGLRQLHFFRFEARNTSLTQMKIYPDGLGTLTSLNDCTHLLDLNSNHKTI